MLLAQGGAKMLAMAKACRISWSCAEPDLSRARAREEPLRAPAASAVDHLDVGARTGLPRRTRRQIRAFHAAERCIRLDGAVLVDPGRPALELQRDLLGLAVLFDQTEPPRPFGLLLALAITSSISL